MFHLLYCRTHVKFHIGFEEVSTKVSAPCGGRTLRVFTGKKINGKKDDPERMHAIGQNPTGNGWILFSSSVSWLKLNTGSSFLMPSWCTTFHMGIGWSQPM